MEKKEWMLMKKNNLSQIRQNISKRKQSKTKIPTTRIPSVKNTPFFNHNSMEDEERHGFSPTLGQYPQKRQESPYLRTFLMRSVIAAIIFFVTMISMSSNYQWAEQPKNWTSYAMTEEFPFATVNQWYQVKFGAPFALETDLESREDYQPTALPASGHISQTFQENGQGIMISSKETTEVIAVDAGTVLFAGNHRETGRTVIVQHADSSTSIYGHLSDVNVHSYQSIRANQKIGTYKPDEAKEAMYFAIEKGNKFIDPIQVIEVDEQP
ncbi:stage IV sporulation protein FA [Gracilibacillus boraciitolerans JCM 21714]|uniref:Stage IV sporulation protein FA n=2 Tax=Gracilibacillus boraciitolerans TaxID=307521 RepID=W4VHH9_9BACI|nr:stage IV sporulation protein FA [Gracilibacillus boraciitolerans JCM 21714]